MMDEASKSQSQLPIIEVVRDLRSTLHKEFHDVLGQKEYILALNIADTLMRLMKLEALLAATYL